MSTNVLTREEEFTAFRKRYQDEWEFYDLLRRLMSNEGFEQAYKDKFREGADKYMELINQAEEVARKYFGGKSVELQACYTEVNYADRVLNINLINYNRSEPTRISDILQQEKGTNELNIYCNKKHEIHAHREDKKRYYEFKEGAHYEMTSTWPVKGMCTMVMNVSSDGITEILKFNGEDFVPSKEILELIKQNDELYIQGLPLYDAVIKLLEKDKAADVVPANLRGNESIMVNQDRRPEENLTLAPSSTNSDASTQTEIDLQHTEKVTTQQIATQAEVGLQHVETQTKVASQAIATQVEVDLQHTEIQTEVSLQEIAIQTEVNLQHAGTQTEIDSQRIDGLISEDHRLRGENAELMESNERLEDEVITSEGKLKKETQRNAELEGQKNGLQGELLKSKEEIQALYNKLEGIKAEQEKLYQKFGESSEQLIEANRMNKELKDELENVRAREGKSNQELEVKKKIIAWLKEQIDGSLQDKLIIEELEKQNNILQDKYEKKEQENAKLHAELAQKDKELAKLQEEEKQKLESVREEIRGLEKKLEVADAEKRALEKSYKQEINKLEEELEIEIKLSNEQLKKREKHLREEMKKEIKEKTEEFKNELKLQNEKFEKQEEIVKEIMNGYGPQLKLMFEAYKKEEIEELKQENEELKTKLKLVKGERNPSQEEEDVIDGQLKCSSEEQETYQADLEWDPSYDFALYESLNSKSQGGEKKESWSSSIDSAYNRDEEDNFCSSKLGCVSLSRKGICSAEQRI